MAYVSTSWGRPIQGVSQQPDRIRMEGQCTEQVNFIPDVVKGLTRRTSSRYTGLLEGEYPANAKHYDYDRGDEAYYMRLMPNSNTIAVYDLQGRLQRVTGAVDYISHPNPSAAIDMHTVGDFTFIVNRTTKVLMDGTLSPTNSPMGIVYVQYATYGKEYQIIGNGGVLASYETPDGAEAPQVTAIKTDYVARRLATEINGGHIEGAGGVDAKDFPGVPGWSAEVHTNVLYIRRDDGADFTLATKDSQAGQDLKAIKGSVKAVADLPPLAPDGYNIRVTGEGKSSKDDYWLVAHVSTDSKVTWREGPEPGIPVSFNKSTMPHVLVRESIGTDGIANFVLRQGEWENREVGGTDSNPVPAFINPDNPTTIQSVGTFQNRLFFLSEEIWIAGRSGLFFNFWRESGNVAVDTDPLEGYADTNQINYLHNYQLLNGDLVLFSDKAQFIIKGDKPVTKASLTVQQITSYPNNIRVTPQAAGENIFFAFDAAGFTGIRELFTDNYSDTKKAFPITDYVSKYVTGSATQLLSSPNYNTLFIRTAAQRGSIWVYNWVWQGDQKVQSAWHKWEILGTVEHLFFNGDRLYIITNYAGGSHMHYMYMINDPDDNGLPFSARLDFKRELVATYDGNIDRWTIPAMAGTHVTPLGGYSYLVGTDLEYTIEGGRAVFAEKLANRGDDVPVLLGYPYQSRYIPTNPVVKDARDRVIGLDKIILQGIYLHYEETGYIKVGVLPLNNIGREYEFFGRYMGQDTNLIGTMEVGDGTYRVPVRGRADGLVFTITSDSIYPFTLRDMECNGTFNQRGQRI